MTITRVRHRYALAAALAGAALTSIVLSGCAGFHVGGASEQAQPPPMQTPIKAPDVTGPPVFSSPSPGITPDAASMAGARARLAHALVPPGARRSTTRPHGVASALALGFWCQPMADAIGYWTVPGESVKSVVSYLSSHPPQKLTLADEDSSNAAGDPDVVAQMVEYASKSGGQDGLIYEVTPLATGAGIRADALVVPTNATCATAPPGTSLGNFGG